MSTRPKMLRPLRGRLPWILAAALGAGSAASVIAPAQPDALPHVFVDPDSVCVPGPDSFSVSIRIGGGDELSCFIIDFSYDRSTLDLLDAREGDLFANSGIPSQFFWENRDADTTRFAGCLLGFQTCVPGNGELVKLGFLPLGCGLVELDLVRVDLADCDRAPITPVTIGDGRVLLCETCTVNVEEMGLSTPVASVVSPNPFRESLQIRLPAGSDLPREACVRDALGRSVRVLEIPRGGAVWSWDGRDSDGHRAPSGVYFITLHDGVTSLSWRVVKLP